MEIIFNGEYDGKKTSESLEAIIRMFRERFHINQFKEMRLSLVLIDNEGFDESELM